MEPVSTFGEDLNIFVVFHNNGLASGCHAFKVPEEPEKFNKTSIISGGQKIIKNEEEFSELAQKYMKVNAFKECFPPKHFLDNEDVKILIKYLFPPHKRFKEKSTCWI